MSFQICVASYLVVGFLMAVWTTLAPGSNRPRTFQKQLFMFVVSLAFWLPISAFLLGYKFVTKRWPE